MPNFEGVAIPMKQIPNLPVKVLVGGEMGDINCQPLQPYSAEAINFFAELSKNLLANPAIRIYSDIAGFAYWCRRANLLRLSRSFDIRDRRIGRGIVLHISPSNVPVNFAFSLAFGLLSGNSNIVRLSESSHAQVDVICEEISKLLKLSNHSRIAGMVRIIRYPRNNEITASLSESCHARVLWGGDATINNLRSMKTSPRCVDICFADRYSLCVMNANAILASNEKALNELVSGFYNDVFLLDQNACSSPHLVLWQGDEAQVAVAMSRFWNAMEFFLLTKAPQPAIHVLDKYMHLCRTAILIEPDILFSRHQNLIYRLRLEKLPADIERYRGRCGFFFEAIDNNFDILSTIISERYQTITYFGLDPEVILNFITKSGLTGVDRVVPVGKALDIGVIWDGYDLIGTLSRVISLQ